jgi:hypothetical protein
MQARQLHTNVLCPVLEMPNTHSRLLYFPDSPLQLGLPILLNTFLQPQAINLICYHASPATCLFFVGMRTWILEQTHRGAFWAMCQPGPDAEAASPQALLYENHP